MEKLPISRRSSITLAASNPRSIRSVLYSVNIILWIVVVMYLVKNHVKGFTSSATKFTNNFDDLSGKTFHCAPKEPGVHQPLGKHYLVDMFDADPLALEFLESPEAQKTVAQFIKNAGMTLLGSSAHKFPCGGITAVWLLSESHVSIHTWPENRYV